MVRGQRIASALNRIRDHGNDITLLEVMRAVSSLEVRCHMECTQVVPLFLILPCHSVFSTFRSCFDGLNENYDDCIGKSISTGRRSFFLGE